MPPDDDSTKSQIGRNNYDGVYGQMMEKGKLDYWLEFKIPRGDVVDCSGRLGRDVFLLEGSDLRFDEYPPTDSGDFDSFETSPDHQGITYHDLTTSNMYTLV